MIFKDLHSSFHNFSLLVWLYLSLLRSFWECFECLVVSIFSESTKSFSNLKRKFFQTQRPRFMFPERSQKLFPKIFSVCIRYIQISFRFWVFLAAFHREKEKFVYACSTFIRSNSIAHDADWPRERERGTLNMP